MRKTYLDNIRWITVVLVVIYHVIYIFNGVTEHGIIGPFTDFQPQDAYQYIVYPWFMLLLFVVSGMCARYELARCSEREFIRKRTVRYLVPSTIGLLVFGWVLGYYNMTISGAFDAMGSVPKPVLFLIMAVSGSGPLWYIQMLWIFSIMLVLIRKVEKDRLYSICDRVNVPILICFTLPVYGSAQILNTPIVLVYRFGIYGIGFLAGYFVLSHEEVMDRIGKNSIGFIVPAIVSGVAFVIVFWGRPYPEHEVLDTLLCNAYAWFGTLGILAFMKNRGNFENGLSRFMCRKSWGLYVFHYLMIAATAWNLHVHAVSLPPLIVYILVAIAAFAGSFVLYEIMSRIPVIRWCVLGIEKEKRT